MEIGTRVNKILQLQDDIKLALATADIRIEAPIPGKPYVGIEVPNQSAAMVGFKDVLKSLLSNSKYQHNPLVVCLLYTSRKMIIHLYRIARNISSFYRKWAMMI